MYIDPNTGGLLFQALAALLAVFSGAALLFSGKIRAALARLRRNIHNDPAAVENPPHEPESDSDGDR